MSIWTKLLEWWNLLWHHAHAGTLPDAPKPGDPPVAIPPANPGVVTPPAPVIPEPVVPPSPAHGTFPAGVTLVDTLNGLVKIDAAEAIHPGQLYACQPSLALLGRHSQAFATVAYNCAYGKSADEGLGMHLRVNTMVVVPVQNALTPEYTNSYPFIWVQDAWTVGAEFDTWDTAIAHAVFMAGNLAKGITGGNAGFVPPGPGHHVP